jgi:glutamate-5-semialdehyde dehydrogenase
MLKMEKYIDVVIPRGGKSLIKAVVKHSKIAVFRHLDGNCHTYFHQDCDFDKARKILINAKLRRVSICGATESLLVDKKIADQILPLIVSDLESRNCEIRGDVNVRKICPSVKKATDKDFYTEFLDNIISIKIVRNIEEAVNHINKYSSSHTESIITENLEAADYFFSRIDSAIIMHNASTQFADGGEFGLGAEVGIATSKLHARGPVGLEQLVTYKYRVSSDFAIRS